MGGLSKNDSLKHNNTPPTAGPTPQGGDDVGAAQLLSLSVLAVLLLLVLLLVLLVLLVLFILTAV